MMEDITRLESPIDVQILLHKAFHALSLRVEKLAADSEKGGDLKEFEEQFGDWVKQLLYHATTEDNFMTGPLQQDVARDNEAEHTVLITNVTGIIEFVGKGDSAGLEDSVKAAMFTLDEKQHEDLVESANDIKSILTREMGQDRVITRTRRQPVSQGNGHAHPRVRSFRERRGIRRSAGTRADERKPGAGIGQAPAN